MFSNSCITKLPGLINSRYTVEIYDNGNGCPAAIQTIDITGPTYLELGPWQLHISRKMKKLALFRFQFKVVHHHISISVGGLPTTPTSAVNTVSNLAEQLYH